MQLGIFGRDPTFEVKSTIFKVTRTLFYILAKKKNTKKTLDQF